MHIIFLIKYKINICKGSKNWLKSTYNNMKLWKNYTIFSVLNPDIISEYAKKVTKAFCWT